MRSCQNCGVDITLRHGSAKFCSVICGNRSRNRIYRQKHPRKMKEKARKENSDPVKRMFTRVKSRAKIQGIPFDLTLGDISIPAVCPVLGIPLVTHQGRQGYHPNSPSLDRITPKLGYIRGNVRVVSARANLLKNDATISELELVLKDLKELNIET